MSFHFILFYFKIFNEEWEPSIAFLVIWYTSETFLYYYISALCADLNTTSRILIIFNHFIFWLHCSLLVSTLKSIYLSLRSGKDSAECCVYHISYLYWGDVEVTACLATDSCVTRAACSDCSPSPWCWPCSTKPLSSPSWGHSCYSGTFSTRSLGKEENIFFFQFIINPWIIYRSDL